MIVRPWGGIAAPALSALYAAERRRWLDLLQWDSASSWREVEHARAAWGLPGFVALDAAGTVRGMTFYLPEDDHVDIGGLIADEAGTTAALVDAVLAAATEKGAMNVRILALDTAPALDAILTSRGFAIEPHAYLSLPLGSRPLRRAVRPGDAPRRVCVRPPVGPVVRWRQGDEDAAAALLARSYDREAGALFAPHHEAGEWVRYVGNLITHVGCGTFSPAHSVVLRDGGELRGLALITDIGPRTAHLVQLAVDPTLRGQGVGARLLEQVSASLSAARYARLTLMVAQGSHAARALYARAGFRPTATFLSGRLPLTDRRQLRPAI